MPRAAALKLHGLLAHWDEVPEAEWPGVHRLIEWEHLERKRRGLERRLSAAHILSQVASQLNRLLDAYGASALEQAIAEALAGGVPHPNAVAQALERGREQRHLPPPLAIVLPDNAKARNIVVRPGSLAAYDQLDMDTHNDRAENPERSDDDND